MRSEILSRRLLAASATAAILLSVLDPAYAIHVTWFGPSGGTGGAAFGACSLTVIDGQPLRITVLRVRSEKYIDSIQVRYSSGQVGPVHGGSGGALSTINLAPDENITSIAGKYGRYVDSLVIQTSTGRNFSFGGNGGDVDYFYGLSNGMWISDFTGRSGKYLDAVGICALDPR